MRRRSLIGKILGWALIALIGYLLRKPIGNLLRKLPIPEGIKSKIVDEQVE